MKILFSQPVSFPLEFACPPDFVKVADEGLLSWKFAKHIHPLISERLVMIYLAVMLLSKRKQADWIVTGRYGMYFALLQGLIPWGRKRLLLLDVEWYGDHKTTIARAIKNAMHRYMAKGSYRISVFCRIEGVRYSQYYNIPQSKFAWLPYVSNADRCDFELKEDDYIFTGGLHHRDYETLYYAVKDIPINVVVVAPKESIAKSFISANMTVTGEVSSEQYYRFMAKAKIVVLSLEPGLRRCPGIITYVTAMKLGKAVIVNEMEGASDYIQNGINGILVNPKDAYNLRSAILNLLHDDELRKVIGDNAYSYASSELSTSRLYKDLNRLLSE